MKSLTRFSWPILAELLLGFAVGMLFFALLGRISDSASGAVGSVNSLFGLFQMMFLGLSQAGGILIAHAAGSGDQEKAARHRGTLLGIFLVALLLVMSLVGYGRAFLISDILGLHGNSAIYAGDFCRIAQWSLAFNGLAHYFTAVFRSSGNSLVPLLVALINHSVCFFCLWLLPADVCGFQFSGIERLAISQLIGTISAMSSALCAMLFLLRLPVIIPGPGAGFMLDLRPILGLAAMVVLEPFAYNLAQVFISRMYAGLGETALAAKAYAGTLSAIPSLPGIALGWGAQMQVSYLAGAGKIEESRKLVLKSCRTTMLIGPLSSLAVYLLSGRILRIFSQDPAVIAATEGLLAIYVLLEIGRSCNTTLAPSLKARGDAKFVARTSFVVMLLVCVPLAWLLGVGLKLGVTGLALAMASDEMIRGLINLKRWNRLS